MEIVSVVNEKDPVGWRAATAAAVRRARWTGESVIAPKPLFGGVLARVRQGRGLGLAV